jgi:pimeloyl-ACP methyl ester carboxylesterase
MMPDLRGVEIFSGAGHFIQMERPDDVSDALVTFASSLDWN